MLTLEYLQYPVNTTYNTFSAFLHKKGWKIIFQRAFGVCCSQMLAEIYNTSTLKKIYVTILLMF